MHKKLSQDVCNFFQNFKHALLAQDQSKEYSHNLDFSGLRLGIDWAVTSRVGIKKPTQ